MVPDSQTVGVGATQMRIRNPAPESACVPGRLCGLRRLFQLSGLSVRSSEVEEIMVPST